MVVMTRSTRDGTTESIFASQKSLLVTLNISFCQTRFVSSDVFFLGIFDDRKFRESDVMSFSVADMKGLSVLQKKKIECREKN